MFLWGVYGGVVFTTKRISGHQLGILQLTEFDTILLGSRRLRAQSCKAVPLLPVAVPSPGDR